jgi:hypothetical protein
MTQVDSQAKSRFGKALKIKPVRQIFAEYGEIVVNSAQIYCSTRSLATLIRVFRICEWT